MTTKKKVTKKVTKKEQGETEMSKKENKEGLKTREEMQSSGEKTGKIAARTFLANGKYHVKGEEILGVSKEDMKKIEEQGLVE